MSTFRAPFPSGISATIPGGAQVNRGRKIRPRSWFAPSPIVFGAVVGSSVSRSQSPKKFIAITTMVMARPADTPATMANVTKSLSLMLNTSPRACRANLAQTVAATATITLPMPAPPAIATMINANRTVGEPEHRVHQAHEDDVGAPAEVAGHNHRSRCPTTAPVPKATRLMNTDVRAP